MHFFSWKYPALSLYFPNVVRVRSVLKEEMEEGVVLCRAQEQEYLLILINILLNLVPSWLFLYFRPRYNFHFVELAYKRVYDPSYVIELFFLKDKLFTLFGEYAKSSNGSYSNINMSSTPLKLLMWKKALIHWWTYIL